MVLQLFNLENDPREQNDVAEQYPAIVKQIEGIMKEAHVPATIERFRIAELGD